MFYYLQEKNHMRKNNLELRVLGAYSHNNINNL